MNKSIVYRVWCMVGLLLFSLYTLFIPHHTVYAASGTFGLSPSTGTFNKGCSFSVDITISTGGTTSDGADAILLYDGTRFNVTSIRTGSVFSDYPSSISDPQAGKIAISGVSNPGSSYTGSGVFATINFTVQSTAPAGVSQITFDFDANDKAKTNDSNIGSIQNGQIVDNLNSVTNGSYTVGTGACGSTTGQGSTGISTPSATPVVEVAPPKVLPEAGDKTGLVIFGVVGSFLTILGFIGLALL